MVGLQVGVVVATAAPTATAREMPAVISADLHWALSKLLALGRVEGTDLHYAAVCEEGDPPAARTT